MLRAPHHWPGKNVVVAIVVSALVHEILPNRTARAVEDYMTSSRRHLKLHYSWMRDEINRHIDHSELKAFMQ